MQVKEDWTFSNFNNGIDFNKFFTNSFYNNFSDSEISSGTGATTTPLSADSPLSNNGPLSFPDFSQGSEMAPAPTLSFPDFAQNLEITPVPNPSLPNFTQSSETAPLPEVSSFNPIVPPIWGTLPDGRRVMGGLLEFIPQDIPASEVQSLSVCGFFYTGYYYL